MPSSMCISTTGRPTFAQMQNEQRRQRYEYYRVSQAVKTGIFAKQLECATCEFWRNTETESGCSAPFSCSVLN